jgi:hypothetical protein
MMVINIIVSKMALGVGAICRVHDAQKNWRLSQEWKRGNQFAVAALAALPFNSCLQRRALVNL